MTPFYHVSNAHFPLPANMPGGHLIAKLSKKHVM